MIESSKLYGYRRDDGRFGIRNYVAVIAAADNVNPLVYELARRYPIVPIPATFGRGQIGEDFEQTVRTMGHFASHPNVYRALVVSFEPESAQRIAAVAREAGRPCEELSMLERGSL
ncbi:MAG: UxaA family hydrolase, partial [Polyangiaceae bacterium]